MEKTKSDLAADRASVVKQLRGKARQMESLHREVAERDRTLAAYQDRITQAAAPSATAEAHLKIEQRVTFATPTTLLNSTPQKHSLHC